jgi:hypothetical protein
MRVSLDFSDGGMLFATDEDIERGETITLTFDIGRVKTVKAAILRTERIEDGKFKHRAAVQFRIRERDKAQKDRFTNLSLKNRWRNGGDRRRA